MWNIEEVSCLGVLHEESVTNKTYLDGVVEHLLEGICRALGVMDELAVDPILQIGSFGSLGIRVGLDTML